MNYNNWLGWLVECSQTHPMCYGLSWLLSINCRTAKEETTLGNNIRSLSLTDTEFSFVDIKESLVFYLLLTVESEPKRGGS